MKTSKPMQFIFRCLLVVLISGGASLLFSSYAVADDSRRESKQQRWEERQERQQNQRELRQERRQPRNETVRKARHQTRKAEQRAIRQNHRKNARQALAAQRRAEHKELRRDLKRTVRKEVRRNLAGRAPIIKTVTRARNHGNRAVIRTVSRPAGRHVIRDYRRPHKIYRPGTRHDRRRHEDVVIRSMPRGSRTVVINNNRYHTHRGHYYRDTRRGYLQVRPPLGAFIADLSFGAFHVTFGGLDYYIRDNVFYRHTPRGYQVVETPAWYQETDHDPVRVAANLLNIRTGPGLSYGVIGRLELGEQLIVTAVAPNWYYVLLPNGDYGWVMSRHTSQIAQG